MALTFACLFPAPAARGDEPLRIKLEFSGGHDTNPVDRGRPVNLVAGALGVPPEVFRDAFSRVKPAPAGQEPNPEQVRANKSALMATLSPYGITNERLDTVSGRYRYRRDKGELWPVEPAVAMALVENHKVVGFHLISGGYGYSSPPTISIPGYRDVAATVELSYSNDFAKNGAISAIKLKTPAK
jgi:hypothetical protein